MNEMEESKISVIIPIYNGERYLHDCFESIKKQTYSNLEIILVNDGSTDNSKDICEEWAKNDSRVKVYNNKNNGVSYSRNFGIDKATGEYIIFIDCDDFIEKEAIETLMKNIKENDLILANYYKYYSNKKVIKNPLIPTKNYSKREFINEFWDLYNAYIISSPCNRLYKNDILKQYNIKFKLDYNLGEDLIFNLDYIERCNTICVINKYLYNYRYTENSLTTKYRENYMEIQLELNKYIKDFLTNNNCYNEECQKQIDRNISNIIISGIQSLFLKTCMLSNKEIENVLLKYLSIKEIEVLKKVNYKEFKLQFFKKMIENKKVKTIIIYSKLKETIRRLVK